MDGLPTTLPEPLRRRAEAGAAWLRERKAAGHKVTVVHHIDADGVCAGAIAANCLEGAGIPHRMQAVKSLDQLHLDLIRDGGAQAIWFCDLGSTAYMHFPDVPRLVCDHHQLVRDGTEESFAHVNPLLDGLPGESISGSGACHLVAAAFEARNVDLLPMALVGAAADLQDRHGPFAGANAALVEQGVALGLLDVALDLAWFGVETRPLRKLLTLGSEPQVPSISGNGKGAELLIASCGIDDADATYADLTPMQRTALRSRLVERLLTCGGTPVDAARLARPVVRIRKERPGPTRELREFGTLLNSTARYGRPDVGLAVARGDRDAAYKEARDLLLDHRRNLAGALDILARSGVAETPHLQWVHLRDQVLDTVVGIVAGMALDALGLRKDKPLIAFAHTPDGRTKVSSRAPHQLQGRGLDLSDAMRTSAAAFGGQGGGHKGAAGATIPRGAELEFLARVDAMVGAQLGLAVAASAAAGTASR